MSESTQTSTTTTTKEQNSIVDQIKDMVADAVKEQGQQGINTIIQSIKDKMNGAGVEFTEQMEGFINEAVSEIFKETGEALSTKVDKFLDSKKDQWAIVAVEDPDTARRQLRTFWGGIAAAAFVVGAALGYFAYLWI